jgi:tetratricopeptide (TPR) repeat protein
MRREIGERWGIATVLNNLGVVAHRLGDYEEARQLHQEGMGIYQELDSQWGISNGLNNLGLVAEALGEFDRAEQLYRRALAIREEIQDRRGQGWSFYHLGYLAYQSGDNAKAAEWLQASLETWRELGDPWGLLFAMNAWGQTAIALGELDEARTHLRQVLQKALAQRTVAVALRALVGWAMLLAQEDQAERAVEILALIQHHPASEGQTKDQAKRVQNQLTSQLSRQAVAAAWQRGESKKLEEVVATLLQE